MQNKTSVVTHLLVKVERSAPLVPVESFGFSTAGIEGGVVANSIRQVLILQADTLERFDLQPGDIRENVIVDTDELYDLPSGTVVKIGDAEIRLTYHCEPCGRVSPFVKPKDIMHKRGYLGLFLNEGTMRVGDVFTVLDQRFEEIPYELPERIAWFLDKYPNQTVTSKELLDGLGLSISYARALPALLRRVPEHYRAQVKFISKR